MPRISNPLRTALVCAAAALVLPAVPAFSQSTANPPTGNAAAQSPTSTQPEAAQSGTADSAQGLTHKQQRSAHKAEAKAAHAQRKAELSKLEKHGYQPSATEPNYPDNVQSAEKKANGQ